MADSTTLLTSEKDFERTPRGWAKRWKQEISASSKWVQRWQKSADEIIRIFKNEESDKGRGRSIPARIPLYSGNVQTQRALLYGEEPKAAVNRRFADTQDDEARIAGELLERILNNDLSHPRDTFQPVIGYALDDFQLPGLGVMRWRYECDFETLPGKKAIIRNGQLAAPAVPPQKRKNGERVVADYGHWRDFLWSVSRTWLDVRWVAFRAYLTKDDVRKNWGDEVAKRIPLMRSGVRTEARQTDSLKDDPWQRAEIWEIWSKEHRKVFFFCDGYPDILQIIDDPLELDGFFPMPEPMVANLTTSGFIPRPDYSVGQDLYEEFDEVSYRAKRLAQAIKVRGVYDSKNKALARIFQEAFDQDLIPVDNWTAFSKEGGINAGIQLIPIDMLAQTLERLLTYRQQLKALIDEVTGNGDIIRGAAEYVGNGPATATEQSIKSKFASVRLRAKQERFAWFASEALQVKAEIICKHFDPQTMIQQTNMDKSFDAAKVGPALALLKNKFWFYRIEVKPNSVAMRDLTQVKSERMQILEAIGTFMASFGPILQTSPELAPMCLGLLKATLVGFEADKELDGIVNEGIQAWQQAQQQKAMQGPQQDPKAQTMLLKAQADQQKAETAALAALQQTAADSQARQLEIASEVAADRSKQQSQAEFNIAEERQKAALDVAAEHAKAQIRVKEQRALPRSSAK